MPLPVKIEHRIGVQAPAEAIWSLLSDVDGWPAWNPLYPAAAGTIAFDAALTLELALPGEPRRTIRPVVTDWTPNEQIIWKDKVFLVVSTRYIEIERLGEANCIFSNGEIFEGFGLRWFSKQKRRTLKAGFAALGEAVQAKAEALWREQRPGAT